ncbi:hypothetical protein GCM10022243_12840 [Saccharothrix violaceirubra]
MRRTTLPVLAAAAAILIAGCSEKSPGRPSSVATADSGTTRTPGTTGSSSAKGDLNPERYADKPCELLKPAQLSGLGSFKAPESDKGVLGPSCTWYAQKVLEGTTYEVTVVTDGTRFPDMVSNTKDEPVFREAEVAGYRAVSSDGTDGKGNCGTSVEVTGAGGWFLLQASVENKKSPDYTDTCATTEKVAALVVQNLKG